MRGYGSSVGQRGDYGSSKRSDKGLRYFSGSDRVSTVVRSLKGRASIFYRKKTAHLPGTMMFQ